MKAIVYKEYGSPEVLNIEDIPKPAVKENEILVRITASSINYGDVLARNFKNTPFSEFNMPMPLMIPAKLTFGLTKPKNPVLGSEFAGVVETTGSNVTQFKPGDEVFGYRGQSMGAHAEYLAIKETASVALKPVNMSFEEACTIPYGSLMAFKLLKKFNVNKGTQMLVIGASGSIGSYAVQLAKHYGAEVTGVCGTAKVDFVKSLGADKVIDYRTEDFKKSGSTYDIVFDVLGRNEFREIKNLLTERGIYFSVSFKMKKVIQSIITGFGKGKKLKIGLAMDKQDDLQKIKKLAETGVIKTNIDKSFSPEEASEAHRYYESENRKGNVVISFR